MHYVFIILRVYVHVWSDEKKVLYVFIILRICVWLCEKKVHYFCYGITDIGMVR